MHDSVSTVPIWYVEQLNRGLSASRKYMKLIDLRVRGTVIAKSRVNRFRTNKSIFRGRFSMLIKKYITTFVMAIVVAAAVPALATSVSGQTRYYTGSRTSRTVYKRPNVYRRHRKAFNIGIGTGIGMLVGGLLGGKKGVVIGGLAGAGGGALFTHKQKPKNYVRAYRRY